MAELVHSNGIQNKGGFDYEMDRSEDYFLFDEGQPLKAVRERPSPMMLVMLMTVFLLIASMIPSTKNFWVPLSYGFYLRSGRALILVFAGIVVLAKILGIFSYHISKDTKRKFLAPILLLGLLQIISLAWNGQDGIHKGYSFLQTVFMCAPVLTAVLMVSGLSYYSRIKVASWLTIILVFIFCVYISMSFLFPGLRPSAAWLDRAVPTLGFIRVFGPLGGSTSLNFVILPALGFSVGQLFVPSRSKILWGAITAILLIAAIGTGSRGAVLCLGAFCILILLTLRITKALKFLLPVVLVLGIVIAFTGIPERFLTMQDTARIETYKTGLRALTSSPRNFFVGVGHGGLYSLLHDNTIRMLKGLAFSHMATKETEFGFTLTNSHSTILQPLFENGVLGFAIMVIPLLWIFTRLFGRHYRKYHDPLTIQARMTLAGCTASMVLMLTSVFFFHTTWLVFIWAIFVIAGTETMAETRWLAESGRPREADELTYYGKEYSWGK